MAAVSAKRSIDRVKWLCACVMCWPHWVGVSVCHLAFIVVVKIKETLFIQELKPSLNVNVSSEKLLLF